MLDTVMCALVVATFLLVLVLHSKMSALIKRVGHLRDMLGTIESDTVILARQARASVDAGASTASMSTSSTSAFRTPAPGGATAEESASAAPVAPKYGLFPFSKNCPKCNYILDMKVDKYCPGCEVYSDGEHLHMRCPGCRYARVTETVK